MVAITALIQNDAPCVAASMRRYRVAQLQLGEDRALFHEAK